MSRLPLYLLRVALAFAFVYAAVVGFLEPENWVGFLPVFVAQYIEPETALALFGAIEIVIAALILFMPRPVWPSVIGAVLLGGIVFFNIGAMDIVFRDISLALAALALAAASRY